MKMKRIYHPYTSWEETSHNMWGTVPDREKALRSAILFTGNAMLYGEYMRRVVLEWPISCENALTDANLSRKAWVGHAAVALALNIPEDITRQAWGFLSDGQRTLANAEARRAIEYWTERHIQGGDVCSDMGEQMLFEWDSRRGSYGAC
jgi:hypothetical protein